MNIEQLTSLGETLRRDFQALLTEYTINWLDDEPLGQADIEPVHALQAGLAELAFVVYDLAGLEAWLTSGFVPADLALLNNRVASVAGEAAPVGADRFTTDNNNAPRAGVLNENRVGQDNTLAQTHPSPVTAPSRAIGEGWRTTLFSEEQLVQSHPRPGDAATVERRNSSPPAADIYPFHRPTQALPLVQSLEALAQRVESEPNAPSETSEAAGRAAMTVNTRSRRDQGQAASITRPANPAAAASEKLGVQDLGAAGLSQTSDDRSSFLSGAVDMPPALIPSGPATELASRSASGAIPTTRPTPPSSSSAQVQLGVTPDKPPKRGVAIDWPYDETAATSYVYPAEPPGGPFDLAEILDALARSVEQEYKRFYGS